MIHKTERQEADDDPVAGRRIVAAGGTAAAGAGRDAEAAEARLAAGQETFRQGSSGVAVAIRWRIAVGGRSGRQRTGDADARAGFAVMLVIALFRAADDDRRRYPDVHSSSKEQS